MDNKIENFALIIGAMKCGTTSLYNYLAQHPEISACRKKEIGFFSYEPFFDRGLDYYQNQFDWNSDIHKIALDVDPDYTTLGNPGKYNPKLNAAETIAKVQKSTNINFKFIYIIRNPLERIESHYNNALTYHEEVREPNFKVIDHLPFLNVSKYAMQIDEYYKRFDADNILLLNFDDLKADPLTLLKKICKFLDIDSNYEFQDLQVHNSYNSLTRITLPGYSLIRRSQLVKLVIRQIPDSRFKKMRTLLKPLYKKPTSYVKLSAEQKQYFLNQLQSDLHKLNSEYGFDTSRWDLQV